jgi:pyocin large subunit-like protein
MEFRVTEAEYERRADEFLIGNLREGAEECMRSNGDKVRFDARTDEFGVLSAEGFVKTYMIARPLPHAGTSRDYFKSNCRQ